MNGERLGHKSSAVYSNTEVRVVQNGWLIIVVSLFNLLLSLTQQDPSLWSRISRSKDKLENIVSNSSQHTVTWEAGCPETGPSVRRCVGCQSGPAPPPPFSASCPPGQPPSPPPPPTWAWPALWRSSCAAAAVSVVPGADHSIRT